MLFVEGLESFSDDGHSILARNNVGHVVETRVVGNGLRFYAGTFVLDCYFGVWNCSARVVGYKSGD